MQKYFIILGFYIFICLIIFYFIKKNDYFMNKKIWKNKKRSKNNFKGLTSRINLIALRVGKLFAARQGNSKKGNNIHYHEAMEYGENIITNIEVFNGYKIILLALFMAAGGFLGNNLTSSIVFGISGAVIGYFVPELLVRRSRARRIREIEKDLPYIIDLLSITTLSGQNIYNAVRILIEKYNSSISLELTNFIREIDMGIGKTEAYKNLMDRSGSKDFKNLVFLLFQAEKYGSSINQVLSQKSKYMKFELYQMIERKIKKMALLTMFPLVFLILPAFVLLAGGPLIFSVGGSFLQL